MCLICLLGRIEEGISWAIILFTINYYFISLYPYFLLF